MCAILRLMCRVCLCGRYIKMKLLTSVILKKTRLLFASWGGSNIIINKGFMTR